MCNLTTWPQNSSWKISLRLRFLHLLVLREFRGNITARGSRDLTGTRESFSTRIGTPPWCPRQYPVARWELLCTYRFTQPHWEPITSIRYVLVTLKNLLQYEKCSQKSCEKQQSIHNLAKAPVQDFRSYSASYSQHFYWDSRNPPAISGLWQVAEQPEMRGFFLLPVSSPSFCFRCFSEGLTKTPLKPSNLPPQEREKDPPSPPTARH